MIVGVLVIVLMGLSNNKLVKSINKLKYHIDEIKRFGGTIIIISGMIMIFNGVTTRIDSTKIENNTQNNQTLENEDKEETKAKVEDINFTLYDQYRKEHKLSDYKGKTVFLNF